MFGIVPVNTSLNAKLCISLPVAFLFLSGISDHFPCNQISAIDSKSVCPLAHSFLTIDDWYNQSRLLYLLLKSHTADVFRLKHVKHCSIASAVLRHYLKPYEFGSLVHSAIGSSTHLTIASPCVSFPFIMEINQLESKIQENTLSQIFMPIIHSNR